MNEDKLRDVNNNKMLRVTNEGIDSDNTLQISYATAFKLLQCYG